MIHSLLHKQHLYTKFNQNGTATALQNKLDELSHDKQTMIEYDNY